jgi:hypothetical protein
VAVLLMRGLLRAFSMACKYTKLVLSPAAIIFYMKGKAEKFRLYQVLVPVAGKSHTGAPGATGPGPIA